MSPKVTQKDVPKSIAEKAAYPNTIPSKPACYVTWLTSYQEMAVEAQALALEGEVCLFHSPLASSS